MMSKQNWWSLWQRVEGILVFFAGLSIFWSLGENVPWWLALIVFFLPDMSFAAYGFGARIGGATYNLVHLYAFGLLALAVGLSGELPLLASFGTLWLSHAGFDRAFGYGLKAPDSFSLTHMGAIGRKQVT